MYETPLNQKTVALKLRDTPVYLGFDRRYTYGGITESRFEIDNGEDEE